MGEVTPPSNEHSVCCFFFNSELFGCAQRKRYHHSNHRRHHLAIHRLHFPIGYVTHINNIIIVIVIITFVFVATVTTIAIVILIVTLTISIVVASLIIEHQANQPNVYAHRHIPTYIRTCMHIHQTIC